MGELVTKQGRFILRCIVREIDGALVECIEQPVFSREIGVAHRRQHFARRFESALKGNRTITFELKQK